MTSFTDNIVVQSVCWTLIHSLWQGLLLAILCGTALAVTKRTAPAVRYMILAGLFFGFIAVTLFTFLLQYRSFAQTAFSHDAGVPAAVTFTSTGITPGGAGIINSMLQVLAGYFNANAPLIVLAWLLVLVFKSVRLVSGLRHIHNIRTMGLIAPGDHWHERLQQLAQNLGLKRPVAIAQSQLTAVPAMAGYLKPVILLPVGMLTQLTTAQVEAILVHELAHILRRDYLVNMIQSFAETVFFFNPALLWVSALIREEREHCCDEIAVDYAGSKKSYIESLIFFEEQQSAPLYVMAFPGRTNQLISRSKRILLNRNKPLDGIEKMALAGCCLLTCVLAAAAWQQAPGINGKAGLIAFNTNNTNGGDTAIKGHKPRTGKTVTTTATTHTIQQKRSTSSTAAKKYYTQDDGYVTDRYNTSDYTQLQERYRAEAERLADLERDRAGRARQLAQQAEEQSHIIERTNRRQQLRADREAHRNDLRAMEEDKKMQQNRLRKLNAPLKPIAPPAPVETGVTKTVAPYNKQQQPPASTNNIISELVYCGIIKDEKALRNYRLSNESLVVNNVRQPVAIHEKLKDMFISHPGMAYLYNYDYNTSVTLN